jgi:hypothetical protein
MMIMTRRGLDRTSWSQKPPTFFAPLVFFFAAGCPLGFGYEVMGFLIVGYVLICFTASHGELVDR